MCCDRRKRLKPIETLPFCALVLVRAYTRNVIISHIHPEHYIKLNLACSIFKSAVKQSLSCTMISIALRIAVLSTVACILSSSAVIDYQHVDELSGSQTISYVLLSAEAEQALGFKLEVSATQFSK